VARNASVANRRHVLVAEAHDLADIVIPHTACAAPVGNSSPDFSQARRVWTSTPNISAAFPIFTRAITAENKKRASEFCQQQLPLAVLAHDCRSRPIGILRCQDTLSGERRCPEQSTYAFGSISAEA
jgi:hypothetical protein